MADEQEIQVELNLDQEPQAQDVVVDESKVETAASESKPAPQEDPISALQKQYNDLKAQDEARARALEQSQRAEAEARAVADRAAREAAEARTKIADTSFQSVEHEIAAIDSAMQIAKREYASAMEAADYTKAADAQAKIAEAAADKKRLERDKIELDAARKRQTVVLDRPAPQQQGPSQRVQAWLNTHPECVQDEEKYYQMVAADRAARKAGIPVESDDYFAFVDRRMGYAADDTNTNQQQAQHRSRPMPAAPPSRDAAATPGGGKLTVNLTQSEVKSATDGTLIWNYGPNKGKPIGTQEMARRKALLQREGKYANISIN